MTIDHGANNLPDRVVGGMRNHCHETDVIVKHCYGYYKKECPKTRFTKKELKKMGKKNEKK